MDVGACDVGAVRSRGGGGIEGPVGRGRVAGGEAEQVVGVVAALDADVDVLCAGEVVTGADVAAGQAGAGDGDLDADRVLAWVARKANAERQSELVP